MPTLNQNVGVDECAKLVQITESSIAVFLCEPVCLILSLQVLCHVFLGCLESVVLFACVFSVPRCLSSIFCFYHGH